MVKCEIVHIAVVIVPVDRGVDRCAKAKGYTLGILEVPQTLPKQLRSSWVMLVPEEVYRLETEMKVSNRYRPKLSHSRLLAYEDRAMQSITSPSFIASLPFILRWEGGFVDDPDDRGGRTNKGVTQTAYQAWRADQGLPWQDVKQINDQEVAAIYYQR